MENPGAEEGVYPEDTLGIDEGVDPGVVDPGVDPGAVDPGVDPGVVHPRVDPGVDPDAGETHICVLEEVDG